MTNRWVPLAMFILITGCASKGQLQSNAPVDTVNRVSLPMISSITAETTCKGSGSLERDLSDGSSYAGSAQIYLTPMGETCRYSK